MTGIALELETLQTQNKILEDMLTQNKILVNAMVNSDQEFLSGKQAADTLDIGYMYFMSTFRKKHSLTHVRHGKRVMFKTSEIMALRDGAHAD